MNNNKSKKTKIYIGNAWAKEGQYGAYQSVSFKGGYEKDEFEVIIRRKSDQQEMALDKSVSIAIFPVREKKSEKGPDFDIVASFDE